MSSFKDQTDPVMLPDRFDLKYYSLINLVNRVLLPETILIT